MKLLLTLTFFLLPSFVAHATESCEDLLNKSAIELTAKLGSNQKQWRKFLDELGPTSSNQREQLKELLERIPQSSWVEKKSNAIFFWRFWALKDTLKSFVQDQIDYNEFDEDFEQLKPAQKRALFLRLTGKWWYDYEPNQIKKILYLSRWLSPVYVFYKFVGYLNRKLKTPANSSPKNIVLTSRVEDFFNKVDKPGFFKSLFLHHARELYFIEEFKKTNDYSKVIEILEYRVLQLGIFKLNFRPGGPEYKYLSREIARAEIILLGLNQPQSSLTKSQAEEIYQRYNITSSERWEFFNFPNILNNSVKMGSFLMLSSIGLVSAHLFFEAPTIEVIIDDGLSDVFEDFSR